MKTPLVALSFVLAIACTLSMQSPAADAKGPKGKLVIVGGGGTTPEIIERALTLAGGKGARMLIVPQASSDPKAGEESREFWGKEGAKNIGVLDLTDPKRALEEVSKAAFIWMPGGDQSRLVDALAKTGIPELMRKRYEEGAVVGGTSAGAAVMSKVMLIGGDKADLVNVRSGGSQTTDGFGLWDAAVVDQHFVKRQRFTRLLACVIDHSDLIGVGIDEKTAIVVSGNGFEVIGDSSVLVVDARTAKKSAAKAGELLAATDMKLHLLRRGDKFDLGDNAK